MIKQYASIIILLVTPLLHSYGAAHCGAGKAPEVDAVTVTARSILTAEEVSLAFDSTKKQLLSFDSSKGQKEDAAKILILMATAQEAYENTNQSLQLQAINSLLMSHILFADFVTAEDRTALKRTLDKILEDSTKIMETGDAAEVDAAYTLVQEAFGANYNLEKAELDFQEAMASIARAQEEMEATIARAMAEAEAEAAARAKEEAEACAKARALEEAAHAAFMHEQETNPALIAARAASLREQEATLPLIEYSEADGIVLPQEHKNFLVRAIKAANRGEIYWGEGDDIPKWKLMHQSGLTAAQKHKFQTCISKTNRLSSDAPFKTLRAKITFAERPWGSIELGAGTAIRLIGAVLTRKDGSMDMAKVSALQNAKTKEEIEAILGTTDTPTVTWFGS